MIKLPEFCLLGLKTEDLKPCDRTLIWYMLAAARILFARYWKEERIPEIYGWKAKLIYIAEMDKLTKKLRGCSRVDFKEWHKWTEYCKKDSDFQKFALNMDL